MCIIDKRSILIHIKFGYPKFIFASLTVHIEIPRIKIFPEIHINKMSTKNEYPVMGVTIKILQIQYLWPTNKETCDFKFYLRLYSMRLLAMPLVIGLIIKKVQISQGKYTSRYFIV